MQDPNPLVNGKGIKTLRNNGVDVEVGLLNGECKSLNAFYSKYITTGLPFITVKMAQSLDGKITKKLNSRLQITSKKAQRFGHRLRTEYDAVLIGKRTALIDNPLLTPRLVSGRTPTRIILDTHFQCDPTLAIFDTINLGKIYIATASNDAQRIKRFNDKGVGILPVNVNDSGSIRLSELVAKLGKLRITSVLVEGGAEVFSSFLRERLVDRVILVIAPLLFGEGVDVIDKFTSHDSIVEIQDVTRKQLGQDYM
ncbi:unnamed protein product, partial [marine sediment metagenome]